MQKHAGHPLQLFPLFFVDRDVDRSLLNNLEEVLDLDFPSPADTSVSVSLYIALLERDLTSWCQPGDGVGEGGSGPSVS